MAYTTIDDPSVYFQTALYTGNAGVNNIVNDGNSNLQPDLLWLKSRSLAQPHTLRDSSRGTNKFLYANDNSAEGTNTYLTAYNSDGFSLNSTDNEVNGNGDTYVAWQWKANGGSTTSFSESGNNPGGDRQANTTAGFSIIDYVGTGGAGTIAHGLGKVPEWIIFKDRSSDGDNWFVYHVSTGNDGGVRLDTTDGDGDDSNRFNDTSPTTSVFTVGASGGVNDDSKSTIAYCWAPIQGYSKFGSYTGTANAKGPFVYTGFKPAWVMIRNTQNGEGWMLHDTTVDDATIPGNTVDQRFQINETQAEVGTTTAFDFLSNGFKVRTDTTSHNGNGHTIIYMAFAESPFVSSEGVPTTAR